MTPEVFIIPHLPACLLLVLCEASFARLIRKEGGYKGGEGNHESRGHARISRIFNLKVGVGDMLKSRTG